jgi:hypothetical protein
MTTTLDALPVESGTVQIDDVLEEMDESGFDVDADPRLGDILTDDGAPMYCTWQVGR